MSVIVKASPMPRLSAEQLALWRDLPVAIVGDELGRTQVMQAAIKPVTRDVPFVGQALTVRGMVGDNAPLHYAIAVSEPGDVIVADAGSHEDTAIWGGILHTAAKARGVVAVVLDGALRDVAEIRDSGLPAFCRAVVPAGPHKSFSGEVNGAIQCGGVAVGPGDLLIGDDDGIVVVRQAQLDGLHERCLARIKGEEAILEGIAAGKTTVELFDFPPAELRED